MFYLLSEQQQLLLPLEIDFALGLVLSYLTNFGYLGKGDKGLACLGSEDKNVCMHIPFAPFFGCFPWAFKLATWKEGGARGRQNGVTKAIKKAIISLHSEQVYPCFHVGKAAMSLRDEVIFRGPSSGVLNNEFWKTQGPAGLKCWVESKASVTG